jgi:hypothetical protein
MLVRDVDGQLVLISRKDCKTEAVYNEKLYNVRVEYTKKFKNIVSFPTPKSIQQTSELDKYGTDD